VEKNTDIPPNTVIGYDFEHDARTFRITPKGVVVVECLNGQPAKPRQT